MLKFKLPFQKEDFFFNPREKKLFFLIVKIGIGVVILCVVVLIIVGIARSVRPTAATATPQETPPSLELSSTGGIKKPLASNAFIILEKVNKGLESEFILWRTRLGSWDEKAIALYWIPPGQIGLEHLTKMNDNMIDRLFSDVK